MAPARLTGAGENSAIASFPGLQPARFAVTLLQAPVYFEIGAASTPRLQAPAWIELGEENRFTTSVRGIEGSGVYTIGGGIITLVYETDFLARLGAALDVSPYPYSATQESGRITGDSLILRRCWS